VSNWQSATNWQTPIRPTYTTGAIVIESDDGRATEFSHWFPLFRKKNLQYNQWKPFDVIVCCPDVNSGTIGLSGNMTSTELKILQDNGWEIMSHSKYHYNFGSMSPTAVANAGQKRVDLPYMEGLDGTSTYVYKIQEGVKVEEIIIATKNIAEKYITITSNLVNSYTTAAKFSLTAQSITDLLQGCIDDLEGWGIMCKNHVWPFHYGSQSYYNAEAVAIVSSLFDSARGVSGDYNISATNKHLMKSRLINNELTEATIDTILDATKANDYVTIFYGHGGTSALTLGQISYIIDGAMSRGIRILTRSKALLRLS
jgi:hypothetical protein